MRRCLFASMPAGVTLAMAASSLFFQPLTIARVLDLRIRHAFAAHVALAMPRQRFHRRLQRVVCAVNRRAVASFQASRRRCNRESATWLYALLELGSAWRQIESVAGHKDRREPDSALPWSARTAAQRPLEFIRAEHGPRGEPAALPWVGSCSVTHRPPGSRAY
jgi:hypothetical protein